MPKRHRIAVGALLFEGNTLSPVVSDIADFANRYLLRDGEVLTGLAATNTEIAGALELLRLREANIVPLIATNGGSGGRVAAAAYAQFKDEMLTRLLGALPVDGIYLALHGAFIAQGLDDVEGRSAGRGPHAGRPRRANLRQPRSPRPYHARYDAVGGCHRGLPTLPP